MLRDLHQEEGHVPKREGAQGLRRDSVGQASTKKQNYDRPYQHVSASDGDQ